MFFFILRRFREIEMITACFRCFHQVSHVLLSVCMTHAHVLVVLLIDCDDDVTAVVMTAAAVGVACFVVGALAGALTGGAICRRRPAPPYFVSRTTRTNVYGTSTSSTRVLPLPLASADSSMDTDEVFLPASPQPRLTVSDARFKRQLMLKSSESFRTARTRLNSDGTEVI